MKKRNTQIVPRREARIQAKRASRRTLATSTLATGLAVLIGLSGAGATYALLSASVTAQGATVQSGTLTLLVNGSSSAALGNWAVAPSTPIAKAFTVTNTGDAAADLVAQTATTTNPSLASYATARVTPVANSGACTVGLAGTQGPLNGYTSPAALSTIAAGATQTFCLEVGLVANAPGSVSGQSLNFTLNINGTQNAA